MTRLLHVTLLLTVILVIDDNWLLNETNHMKQWNSASRLVYAKDSFYRQPDTNLSLVGSVKKLQDLPDLSTVASLPPISRHSSFHFEAKLIVLGGTIDKSCLSSKGNAIFVYFWKTSSWKRIQITKQVTSHSINDQATTKVDNLAFLYGGTLQDGSIVDTFLTFDLALPQANRKSVYGYNKMPYPVNKTLQNWPPPLSNATLQYSAYDNALYLFGGTLKNNDLSDQLWRFDLTLKKWNFKPNHDFVRPPALTQHCTASYERGKNLFLYGGISNKGYLEDVWILQIDSLKWLKICKLESRSLISARAGHTCTTIDRDIAVFGGNQNGEEADLWYWDVAFRSWETRKHRELSPTGLHSHSAVAVGRDLLIVGGTKRTIGLVVFNTNKVIVTSKWQIVSTGGNCLPLSGPALLYAHASIAGNNYIFSQESQLWRSVVDFSARKVHWQRIGLSGSLPSNIQRATLLVSEDKTILFLLGIRYRSALLFQYNINTDIWMEITMSEVPNYFKKFIPAAIIMQNQLFMIVACNYKLNHRYYAEPLIHKLNLTNIGSNLKATWQVVHGISISITKLSFSIKDVIFKPLLQTSKHTFTAITVARFANGYAKFFAKIDTRGNLIYCKIRKFTTHLPSPTTVLTATLGNNYIMLPLGCNTTQERNFLYPNYSDQMSPISSEIINTSHFYNSTNTFDLNGPIIFNYDRLSANKRSISNNIVEFASFGGSLNAIPQQSNTISIFAAANFSIGVKIHDVFNAKIILQVNIITIGDLANSTTKSVLLGISKVQMWHTNNTNSTKTLLYSSPGFFTYYNKKLLNCTTASKIFISVETAQSNEAQTTAIDLSFLDSDMKATALTQEINYSVRAIIFSWQNPPNISEYHKIELRIKSNATGFVQIQQFKYKQMPAFFYKISAVNTTLSISWSVTINGFRVGKPVPGSTILYRQPTNTGFFSTAFPLVLTTALVGLICLIVIIFCFLFVLMFIKFNNRQKSTQQPVQLYDKFVDSS